jgi:ribose-phosphate pyrophosphokinase
LTVTALDASPTRQLFAGQGTGRPLKIFSGSASPGLAAEIAGLLGLPVGPVKIANFADGEIYVQIQESVRGADVYLVQPICHPVNYNLVELCILLDAFKRASVHQVTAVIPYFAYARQDRKAQGREAITSKLVADLLTTAGANRVVCLDLHAPQIQGFFDINSDHLYATPVLARWMEEKRKPDREMVIVSPDVGGVSRARVYAKKLDAPIAIVDKRRPKHNIAEVLSVIGDVRDKTAVIVDDMIDTAGTLTEVAHLLVREGAAEVYAAATHGLLSGPAIERLAESPILELAITNSIPLEPSRRLDKITVLSVADLLAQAIGRIHEDLSVSMLFE